MSKPQPFRVLGSTFYDEALVARLLDSGAEDPEDVVILDAFRAGIRDLRGMEVLRSLEEADLHQNEISDVAPLRNLPSLRILHLGINNLTESRPFAAMEQLTHLTLFQNEIDDVRPLSGLFNLEALHLRYNLLEDLSSLSELMNLRELTFGNNAVRDVSFAASLEGLELFNGYFNYIEDVTPLAGLTQLKFAYLGYNRIRDIEPLFELDNLLEVHLEGNPVPASHVEELNRYLAERKAAAAPAPARAAEEAEPVAAEPAFIQSNVDVPDRVLRQRRARALVKKKRAQMQQG